MQIYGCKVKYYQSGSALVSCLSLPIQRNKQIFVIFLMPKIPQIPQQIYEKLLPLDTLSVQALLEWKPSTAMPTISPINPEAFFSSLAPNCSPTDILGIPTPPKKVIDTVCETFEKLQKDDIKSICCPYARNGESKRFDLFIWSYWMDQAKARFVQQRFEAGVVALEKRSKKWKLQAESRQLAEDAIQLLGTIPWYGKVKGFEVSPDIYELSALLTDRWLNDDHEEMMITLLQREIAFDSSKSDILVPGSTLSFTQKLIKGSQFPESYMSTVEYRWIRQIADELRSGRKNLLGFLVNRGENHWVAVAIDVAFGIIWYGDPMRKKIDGELEATLKWWTSQNFDTDFIIEEMPTVAQNDYHSCGILSWVSLRNFLLPDARLLPNDPYDIRLSLFKDILLRHSSYHGFEAEAKDFQFTFTTSLPNVNPSPRISHDANDTDDVNETLFPDVTMTPPPSRRLLFCIVVFPNCIVVFLNCSTFICCTYNCSIMHSSIKHVQTNHGHRHYQHLCSNNPPIPLDPSLDSRECKLDRIEIRRIWR